MPRLRIALFAAIALASGSMAAAAPKRANPADVDTIDHIIRADYETVSGPAGPVSKVRQQARDDALYMPGANFVSVSDDNGKLKTVSMTEKQYWQKFDSTKPAYESEIGRRIERYGNVADVRSVSGVRDRPSGPITSRYINYYHLYFGGKRWWIAGIVWQKESPAIRIPASWIGKWEEVTR
jgi:hypothetical protein